jgi:NADPH-dependent ferric siderophore reductase
MSLSMNSPESTLQPRRRVQRVRHELRRREVQVARVDPLGPGFVAVTFVGEDLHDFVSASFDDHVKLVFPGASGEPVMRDYTPRRFDRERRELTIEFALHGHGHASDWARRAAPGQRLVIGGPRGSMIVPTDYDWHLLAGDDSALPAIHRRLEELPAGTRALVLLQVPGAGDRRALASAARLDLQWVSTAQEWEAALREMALPPGAGYAWCAGESQVMARARQILLVDKAHPREDARIAAYWKPGVASHHEELNA